MLRTREPIGRKAWIRPASRFPNPKKEPQIDGALLNIPAVGGTNWFPPSFDPEFGLFYVNAMKGYSLAYLTDTDEKPEGYGGRAAHCGRSRVRKLSTIKPARSAGATIFRAKLLLVPAS